jgi:hypothetical protein
MFRIQAMTSLLAIIGFMSLAHAEDIPEIRIISSLQDAITLFEQADYWGELEPDKILQDIMKRYPDFSFVSLLFEKFGSGRAYWLIQSSGPSGSFLATTPSSV